MKHYYRITTITGKKNLTRSELEDMIYGILVTGQVELDEFPYLCGSDSNSIKNLGKERLERFLKSQVRVSAFRMAKFLFGVENIISVKE